MVHIHPTALVDPHAELDDSVRIGPYSSIGPQVKIGSGTIVQSHVVIEGNTEIGQNNLIFNGVQLGQAPIDLTYKGEHTKLIIGDGNTFREFCTAQPGTLKQEGLTQIGDHNLFMCYVHISHDSKIGNHNILANLTQLGGHVSIEDFCVLGASTGIHQFCRIGSYAMIGAGSMISKDVPPYCLVAGNRAHLKGLNLIGLKRRGFSADDLAALKEAYQFLKPGQTMPPSNTNQHVQAFIQFLVKSQRGIMRPNTGSSSSLQKSI